jgi:transmembrane sensor
MKNTPPAPDDSNAPDQWEALARYLAGESSPDEAERIARWLRESPADAELLVALDNAMSGLALREIPNVDVEAALRRVTARRDEIAKPLNSKIRRSPIVRRLPRTTASPWRVVTLLAAAAVIILAARAVLLRRNGASTTPPFSTAGAGAAHTYATAIGKRDSVRLPDGGRVVLGPASRLVVAAGYGEKVREVELHGEAYFDVVHDPTRPFVVRAGTTSIRDVGTAFAVRNDSGAGVRVIVTSGSVLLRSAAARDSAGALLAAGDVGVVEADGRVTTTRGASTAPYLAWMRDSLVLREAPISEVSGDLRRWYGVSLRVDDSALSRRHLTMTVAGDPIDRVLRMIGLQLGADVERRGDSAIVRPSTRGVRPQ